MDFNNLNDYEAQKLIKNFKYAKSINSFQKI